MGRQRNTKRERMAIESGIYEVDGLNFSEIARGVCWTGSVFLAMLGEHSESLLAEIEFPKGSGIEWFVCASTGLLFDKQSGACRQSTHVRLDLTSLKPDKMTSAEVRAWIKKRQDQSYEWSQIKLRRGPKPKGSVQEPAVEDDYVEVE